MNSVYTLESANLVCGDFGDNPAPGQSTHLEISELKLPGLDENYVDHYPGGAPVGIEIPTYWTRLEATFNLAGWNPTVMAMMGQSARAFQRFTAYGLIRDRRTGQALQGIAVMEGRMGRVNPVSWNKGSLQHLEYSIRSIVHYEFWMQTTTATDAAGLQAGLQEIYFWDFFTSIRRVGGIDLNQDLVRILAIPGVAA